MNPSWRKHSDTQDWQSAGYYMISESPPGEALISRFYADVFRAGVYHFLLLKDKYPNFEVRLKCILMVNPYLLVCSYIKWKSDVNK